MRVSDLDFELPSELIAQRPPDERDGGRLLVVPAEVGGEPRSVGFLDELVLSLPDLLPERALVVVNDTRVLAARLLGHKVGSGGHIELFLLRRLGEVAESSTSPGSSKAPPVGMRYRALARSSKPLRLGAEVNLGSTNRLFGVIASERKDGEREIEVVLSTRDGTPVDAAIEAEGRVPLPPYVDRLDDDADRSRYQTVFARVPGAVAAPTAGFHLSDRLLSAIRARGCEIAAVTLHVGLGTFAPVITEDLDDHTMHEEIFSVGADAVEAVVRAREAGAPVVAIGTTVVRALESAQDPDRVGCVRATEGATKILIQPGYKFAIVDHLLTNFHLPRSTLLALVSAFVGRERILSAYAHAVRDRYRFFSYGDAMLLSRSEAAGLASPSVRGIA